MLLILKTLQERLFSYITLGAMVLPCQLMRILTISPLFQRSLNRSVSFLFLSVPLETQRCLELSAMMECLVSEQLLFALPNNGSERVTERKGKKWRMVGRREGRREERMGGWRKGGKKKKKMKDESLNNMGSNYCNLYVKGKHIVGKWNTVW